MLDFYKADKILINDEEIRFIKEDLKYIEEITSIENNHIVHFSIPIEDYKPVTLDVIRLRFFKNNGEKTFMLKCKLKSLEVLENKVKFSYICI